MPISITARYSAQGHDGDSLGRVAYEAYGAARGWVMFDGSPMPTWDEQSIELREAWEMAGEAVAALYEEGGPL